MFRKLIRKPNSLKFQKYECRVNTILILWAINQSECSVLSAPNSQPPFLANTLDNTIQRSIKSFKLTNQLSAITISRRYVSFAKQLRQRRTTFSVGSQACHDRSRFYKPLWVTVDGILERREHLQVLFEEIDDILFVKKKQKLYYLENEVTRI